MTAHELGTGGKAVVVTMGGTGKQPWGTSVEEHRINPDLIAGNLLPAIQALTPEPQGSIRRSIR